MKIYTFLFLNMKKLPYLLLKIVRHLVFTQRVYPNSKTEYVYFYF